MNRYILGALGASALALAGGCTRMQDSDTSAKTPGEQASNQTPGDYGSPSQTQSGAQTGMAPGVTGTATGYTDSAPAAAMTMTAPVSLKSPTSITLDNGISGPMQLATSAKTVILDDQGKATDFSSIKEGDQVRAAYHFDGKGYQAEQLQVLPADAPKLDLPAPKADVTK